MPNRKMFGLGLGASSSRRRVACRPRADGLEERQLLSYGPEVAVNVNTKLNQSEPATASSYSGPSVIVWTHDKGGGDTDIMARLYDGAGNPVGGDIPINTLAFKDSQPAVAMDASGAFV